MLPNESKNQADALRRHLLASGWHIADVERPFEDEWWAAEFWSLKSIWSPQGVCAYLTWLVDPMSSGDTIWAVHASSERPRQVPMSEPIVRLRREWQQGVHVLVASLQQMREDAASKEDLNKATGHPPGSSG